MIKLYCVGIYFYKDIPFKDEGGGFMTGATILEEAAKLGLRYQVTANGHNQYLSYTPKHGDTFRHPTATNIFPYYGQPLSLQEKLAPIGEISVIFQYTSNPMYKADPTTNPQFTKNLFQDGSEIRIRLLSIYTAI